MKRLAALLALLFAMLPGAAPGHALDPGFLELAHLTGSDWRVTFRQPDVQGRPMPIGANLPDGCSPDAGPEPAHDGRAFVSSWVVTCERGLVGGTIRIDGLENTRTEVLVRYTLAGGSETQTVRLTPDATAFEVPARQGRLSLARSYAALGVNHILEGIDHLLFVLLLLLLIRRVRPLVAAITAFTVAHSASLAAATFGWIVVPAAPVEAVIALSILVLAAELAQPPGRGLRLTERFPWAVSFSFGLLHGLGFASALLEIGLPQRDVPLALFAFNVGVEAGQLLFIGVVLVTGVFLARLTQGQGRMLAHGSRGLVTVAYLVGSLASYWMFARVASFAA